MCSSPHLWFLYANQRLLEQNYKSMGPRLRLLICECKTACFAPELRLSIAPSLHLWFCAFKTATSASELLVSMGCSQPSSVVLCIQNSDFSIRITSIYGSQPPFVFFACKTATLGRTLQFSMCPRPHLFFLHSKVQL